MIWDKITRYHKDVEKMTLAKDTSAIEGGEGENYWQFIKISLAAVKRAPTRSQSTSSR